MNRQEFKQRLNQGPVLMDGAFGTVLHGRGVPIDQSFDAVNPVSYTHLTLPTNREV